jgi:3-oxoacyl-[acyl-carrier-protein] synthase II
MSTSPRICITGIGVVSPLGVGLDSLWEQLLAGQTAIKNHEDLLRQGYRNTLACRADIFEAPPMRRGATMCLEATEQAIQQAGIQLLPDAGVFIGSTLGESAAFEAAAEGHTVRLADYNTLSFARYIQQNYGLTGMVQALATACTAGNYAVGMAAQALRRGDINVAVAGGAEPFSRIAMVGFTRSRAMATEACQPFDVRRNGMLLGEGAGMFVLEREADALARGAQPLAIVHALGLRCDAYHPTAPEPTGQGLADAIHAALVQSGVSANAISWTNLHGSGTKLSDAAEANALRQVFGTRMPLLSGSKGALGHALGAASALELAICVRGLQTQIVPPTPGHLSPDPDLGLHCTTNPVRASLRYAINSSAAFGGLNAALLLERA